MTLVALAAPYWNAAVTAIPHGLLASLWLVGVSETTGQWVIASVVLPPIGVWIGVVEMAGRLL